MIAMGLKAIWEISAHYRFLPEDTDMGGKMGPNSGYPAGSININNVINQFNKAAIFESVVIRPYKQIFPLA